MAQLIERLEALAYDLWWSWQPGGAEFWASFDERLWARSGRNPVRMLSVLGAEGLAKRVDEKALAALEARRAAYLAEGETWHALAGAPLKQPAAYLSAEFGIHESLPIYSGGLGILAGDHVKSASDLGLNFVAVGLLYRNGYVRQQIARDGVQLADYQTYDFAELAVKEALVEGEPLIVEVPVEQATCACKVWTVQVGRVRLHLLDTDLEQNADWLRALTAKLYGGDRTMRIRQELVLGVGGVRALRALGHTPEVWHLNEGHSSFSSLERIRELLSEGVELPEAIARVRKASVFTTHTPVEAGHDRFDPALAWRHLQWFAEAAKLDEQGLLALGRWPDSPHHGEFNMTLLAMHTAERLNGVAALHGEVSRQMFARFWPDTPPEEVPITHVTNGVHAPSWQAHELHAALEAHMPAGFRDRPESDPVWAQVAEVPDEVLWKVHQSLKARLLDLAVGREARRRERTGLPPFADRLDPEGLTIGFARRFAPYKRADLIFSDLNRLLTILGEAPGPVQILFAGKAHPADENGKRLVQRVYEASQHTELAGRVLLIEDYDIEAGRALVQGVDVWLNNPRRPKEASGTSGMKVGMNGGLNFSILDGWWPEGFNGENGWAIGEARSYPSVEAQDAADAESLYSLLEHQVLPTWFDRDASGLPRKWLWMMKAAIRTVTPRFHSDRQVIDYTHHLYCPG